MRRIPCVLCVILLLISLSACGGGTASEPQDGILLYFLSNESTGPALTGEKWVPEPDPDRPDADPAADPQPEDLLNALLAGPSDPDLMSPFPRGTGLISCGWDPDLPGTLLIRLSEQYGGLSDVSLTLADYSIVLTLGQLEGVDSVRITSAGLPDSTRSHTILVPGEAVLEGDLFEPKMS